MTVLHDRMTQTTPSALVTIVVFGASGDLTRRKLVPALHSLTCGGQLSPATQVVGVARTELSDEAFRSQLYDGVLEYARLKPNPHLREMWPRFAQRYTYLAGSYDAPETYRRLAQRLARLDAEGRPVWLMNQATFDKQALILLPGRGMYICIYGVVSS